jgi:hypothetical protein
MDGRLLLVAQRDVQGRLVGVRWARAVMKQSHGGEAANHKSSHVHDHSPRLQAAAAAREIR